MPPKREYKTFRRVGVPRSVAVPAPGLTLPTLVSLTPIIETEVMTAEGQRIDPSKRTFVGGAGPGAGAGTGGARAEWTEIPTAYAGELPEKFAKERKQMEEYEKRLRESFGERKGPEKLVTLETPKFEVVTPREYLEALEELKKLKVAPYDSWYDYDNDHYYSNYYDDDFYDEYDDYDDLY